MTLHGRRSVRKRQRCFAVNTTEIISEYIFMHTIFQLMPFLTYIQQQDMQSDEYSECLNYSLTGDIMT